MTAWTPALAADTEPDTVARVVRLAASPWVTPERVRLAVADILDQRTITAEAVIARLERMADRSRLLADDASTDAAARRLISQNAVVRIVGQPGYPARLADAWPELGAPLWIFVTAPGGELAGGPTVAVVGTRAPTLDGARTARELAALLGRHGVTVVSGMARGIDQAAHLGALDAGAATIAVLGTGFGVDYPRRDGPLRAAVAASGGLVSELLPGTPPKKPSFLWRNRIIAGLADVTVVVEGREGSGALHTARMAAAQGRDVLAVPGPVRAPTSRAPLDLIRDGAQPLTRFDDVLEVLGIEPQLQPTRKERLPQNLGDVARKVLSLLGAVPATPPTLSAATQEPVAAVMAAIAELCGRQLAVMTPRGVVRTRP